MTLMKLVRHTLSHKRKRRLAELFPHLKQSDIETLNEITTDEQFAEYERDIGN